MDKGRPLAPALPGFYKLLFILHLAGIPDAGSTGDEFHIHKAGRRGGLAPRAPEGSVIQADDREVLRRFCRHHREGGGPEQAPIAVEDDDIPVGRKRKTEPDRCRLGVAPEHVEVESPISGGIELL